MRGIGGEQVQCEHPDAVLLQGQIPQGLGEHQQSLQRNMGGRDTGKRKDILHHRAVHPSALRQRLRDGRIRLQVPDIGDQALLPLQEEPETRQGTQGLQVQHHQLRGCGIQPQGEPDTTEIHQQSGGGERDSRNPA